MPFLPAPFRVIALGSVFWAAGFLAPGARAADAPAATSDLDEAKARFSAGRAFYEKGQFQKALDEFQAGFALTRAPAFLINSALCHKKLGNPSAARDDLRSFLKLEPSSPRKAEVERLLAELGPAEDPAPATTPPPTDDPAAAGLLLQKRTATPVAPSAPRPTPPRSASPSVAMAAQASADDDGEPLISTSRSRSSGGIAVAPTVKRRAEPVDDESDERADKPLHRKAWFWGVVGGAVLAGVVGAFLATRETTEGGTLGTIDARVR